MSVYDCPDFSFFSDEIKYKTSADVRRALAVSSPNLEHLAAMLSPAAVPFLGEMAARSRQLTRLRFGKTTQLYGPIYLSNFCTNSCAYCGFAARNRIERRKLTFEEAEQEADILLKRGFQHILLVSGEAEKVLDVDYLEEITRRLKTRFASISIEVQPLSEEAYTRLFKAGITSVAIYQETYNREVYDTVHLGGKKKDFDFRLDTPARACAAGMREVGLGSLLGLAEWRAEGLALGYHLGWLKKQFWKTAFTMSFPRLRPAAGCFEPNVVVTETDLSQLIFALRIFDNDLGLVLSTREQASYRNGMLTLGPTRYSAGSCTAPGGYANPELEGEQFEVGDHRSLDEVADFIRSNGFDPVYKDWDPAFQM